MIVSKTKTGEKISSEEYYPFEANLDWLSDLENVSTNRRARFVEHFSTIPSPHVVPAPGALIDHVQKQHASTNTIMHALYMYYFLGLNRLSIARLFHKSQSTVSNWIARYEQSGGYERRRSASEQGFTQEQRLWIVAFYQKNPTAFLDEAKYAFECEFQRHIALSTVWSIIHRHGLTWKVLERRAMHIKESDVLRFCSELTSIN
ncbi:hypothetical protein Ae201684P_014748 [Aphanomyces euteiches]|uniref:Uncharacterized protein n=1 Tax=Aphanomyces euteiches TaxID=100861 RepID=A0A6G0WXM4_9STRA|nr:hypothetical protein Ae201684_010545 [Aphanomyces euteiches]KAH9089993.1 hypothetical protein Ae201684P_014748 [Aphanomyces euteiches]